MPSGPSSRASPRFRLSTPPFDAAYHTNSAGEPYWDARDDSSTMAPPCPAKRVDMRRIAAWQHRMAPRRFTSSTASMVAVGRFGQWRVRTGDGGVVDERGEATHAIDGCKHPFDVGLVRGISLHGQRAAAGRCDAFHHRGRSRRVVRVSEHDVVTALRAQQRHRFTDPATAAGYQHHARAHRPLPFHFPAAVYRSP